MKAKVLVHVLVQVEGIAVGVGSLLLYAVDVIMEDTDVELVVVAREEVVLAAPVDEQVVQVAVVDFDDVDESVAGQM